MIKNRIVAHRTRRPRHANFAALAAAVGVVSVLVMAAALILTSQPGSRPGVAAEPAAPPAQTAPVPEPEPDDSYRSATDPPVTSPPPGVFAAWALLDLRSGRLVGSRNQAETSTTASMIKAWIAADDLRRAAEAGAVPTAARLGQLRLMIRDSDNEFAELIFQELGRDRSINRLIELCGLTDSSPGNGWWSNTQLSARDTARMGACIADGRAAGPEWTPWLLAEMRAVRGIGDFGIRAALSQEQAARVAIKNGWVDRTGVDEYHVNCLAIGDTWAMGVITRYPIHLGYLHGADICESLAATHLPDAGQTPVS